MKILTVICAVGTLLVLSSAAVCGAWMRAGGASVADSIGFHLVCGIGALVLSALTVLLAVITPSGTAA